MFAESFVHAGCHHTRCEKPTCALSPEKHMEFRLPGDFGRATMDLYADYAEPALYGRLVSMKTGAVAWYRVTSTEPTP
jgi:hypothetical protein